MNAEVAYTEDFERIVNLPRRRLSIETAKAWAEFLTPKLALQPDVALRPWQAQSLADAVQCQGAWLALPVGQGKTLLSHVLPQVLRSERALTIVPASLLEKTQADWRSYHGVWRAPTSTIMQVVTREMLATIRGAQSLMQYAPDLIVIDEADDLANNQSAAVRRIDRFLLSDAGKRTRVVAMTGTPARKSIMNYWHLLWWCLRHSGVPVPRSRTEAQLWGLALDDHRRARPAPGPMGDSLQQAREWFRLRLVETPGVVVVDEDSCDAPLTIRIRRAREDQVLDQAFERFLVEQESPGGIPVDDPLSRWRMDAHLGLGLYTQWDPPPPERWRKAYRAMAKFVRERIEYSSDERPLDTRAQVLNAYPSHPIVAEWRTVEGLFKENRTRTYWISRSTIDSCLAWLRELNDEAGIVWCGSVEFGIALAKEAGLEYYGQKGRTLTGSALHLAPVGTSFVASWSANKKGFNLQPWSRQLIVMPPQSAKWLEQIFGRSHRSGQTEHVVVDVLATSGGTIDAFDAAISEASNVRATVSLTQKLLRADIVRSDVTHTATNSFRWAQRSRG